MTAPLFLLEAADYGSPVVGGQIELTGSEAHHAVAVVRIGPGEQILVGDGAGHRALVRVVSAGSSGATRSPVLLGEVLALLDEPPADPTFTLVQALAKGDRDESAVEAATELGVDTVVPWQADRSIVRWQGERGLRARRKWESVVVAATKQSRRARIPVVEPPVSGPAVRERLRRASLALVLHESASTSLTQVELPSHGEVALVVGPEGGISPAELDAFELDGAVTVRLGPHVLRASTAGPAALAVLAARARWGAAGSDPVATLTS